MKGIAILMLLELADPSPILDPTTIPTPLMPSWYEDPFLLALALITVVIWLAAWWTAKPKVRR